MRFSSFLLCPGIRKYHNDYAQHKYQTAKTECMSRTKITKKSALKSVGKQLDLSVFEVQEKIMVAKTIQYPVAYDENNNLVSIKDVYREYS